MNRSVAWYWAKQLRAIGWTVTQFRIWRPAKPGDIGFHLERKGIRATVGNRHVAARYRDLGDEDRPVGG